MALHSVWQGTVDSASRFERLQGDVQADVVVIGGGLTGLSTALELRERGRSVVVLEAHEVGGGSTGRSTGNLYSTVSSGLASVQERWGTEIARAVLTVRQRALERVAQRVDGLGLACGFERTALWQYATSEAGREDIEREQALLQAAGLAVRRELALPAPGPAIFGPALVLEHQAQLQPFAYAQGLARALVAAGGQVFERSPVLELDAASGRVSTEHGRVQAAQIVQATHTPKGFHAVQAAMVPGQEYGVAFRWHGPPLPAGIFWGRGEPQESWRSHRTPQGEFLVVVGEAQKTGQHDPAASLAVLQAQSRRRFGLSEAAAFHWSAQNFRAADALPYIGRDGSGCLIATGFATDGLTWGTVAASLLADLACGVEPPEAAWLKPGRFAPVQAARGIVEENLSVAKALVRDYLTGPSSAPLRDLAPGEGRIVRIEQESVAAYRTPDGELQVVSSVCTHLKCRVHWNAAETSWDCPCHGSRFATDGRVIEGPALAPLARKWVQASSSPTLSPDAGGAPGSSA